MDVLRRDDLLHCRLDVGLLCSVYMLLQLHKLPYLVLCCLLHPAPADQAAS